MKQLWSFYNYFIKLQTNYCSFTSLNRLTADLTEEAAVVE